LHYANEQRHYAAATNEIDVSDLPLDTIGYCDRKCTPTNTRQK